MGESIKLAQERLAAGFRELGYKLSDTSGVIEGVKVHDQLGRYLFAWHKHPHHLLFYVRKPALAAKSTLRQTAISRHPEAQVNRNPGGETTITILSDGDAETLLGWLVLALPLP